jgi:acyl carrier protein
MSLDTAEIIRIMTGIFRDVLDNDDIILAPATTGADIDEWDSLSHIRLVVAIERQFGVKFTTSELSKLGNVGQMIELIGRKRA